MFGMFIKDSFMEPTSIKTNTGNNRGGHAMKIAGYDDEHKWFICRNSWGLAWGDKGDFYLDYKYLKDCFDLYVYLSK
jgi:C1A family cysteine protease